MNLIEQFKMLSIKRWEYLRVGDSKSGNKCFDELNQIFALIEAEDGIEELLSLFDDMHDEVKFEAAQRLLSHYSVKSQEVIAAIAMKKGLLSFEAKQTLKWWIKKNQN